MELRETGRLRSGSIFLFKNRGEYSESRAFFFGLADFLRRMTGDPNQWMSWRNAGRSARATPVPYSSHIVWWDVSGAEVDPVGFGGECHVCARIDQKGSSQFSVLSSQSADDSDSFSRQGFDSTRGKIFFA